MADLHFPLIILSLFCGAGPEELAPAVVLRIATSLQLQLDCLRIEVVGRHLDNKIYRASASHYHVVWMPELSRVAVLLVDLLHQVHIVNGGAEHCMASHRSINRYHDNLQSSVLVVRMLAAYLVYDGTLLLMILKKLRRSAFERCKKSLVFILDHMMSSGEVLHQRSKVNVIKIMTKYLHI